MLGQHHTLRSPGSGAASAELSELQKKSLQQESRLMELEAELSHAVTRERAALDRAVKAEMRVRQLEQDIAVQQGAARVLCLQFVAMQCVTAWVDTSLT